MRTLCLSGQQTNYTIQKRVCQGSLSKLPEQSPSQLPSNESCSDARSGPISPRRTPARLEEKRVRRIAWLPTLQAACSASEAHTSPRSAATSRALLPRRYGRRVLGVRVSGPASTGNASARRRKRSSPRPHSTRMALGTHVICQNSSSCLPATILQTVPYSVRCSALPLLDHGSKTSSGQKLINAGQTRPGQERHPFDKCVATPCSPAQSQRPERRRNR